MDDQVIDDIDSNLVGDKINRKGWPAGEWDNEPDRA
jgi:hypothetical protein